jgi:hypothetical protein
MSCTVSDFIAEMELLLWVGKQVRGYKRELCCSGEDCIKVMTEYTHSVILINEASAGILSRDF